MKKKEVKLGLKRAVKKVEHYKLNEKLLILEDEMSMKILKETPVEYVKLDVNMSLPLQEFLIRYAEKNIKKEIKENLLLEWAFVDILKKNIKIK